MFGVGCFAHRIIARAASSGYNGKIVWQVWHFVTCDEHGGLFIFFAAGFCFCFLVPGSMLSCFSAFLLFRFSAVLLLCFSAFLLFAFPTSLLLCLSTLLFCLPCFSPSLLSRLSAFCFSCFLLYLLYLLLCFSCFSAFHAFHASLLYLLLFFSASLLSLLLCFCAFLLLLFYFFISSVLCFCISSSCSSASCSPTAIAWGC